MNQDKLGQIREISQAGQLFFTDHAVKQMLSRSISDLEVQEAIAAGEIIEEYPEDKYSPSYLVFGITSQNRALHVLCSDPPRVRIITTYEPDPAEWIDNRQRKT